MPLSSSVAGLLPVLLLAFALGGPADARCLPGVRLTLLHFNDFHGQLESYPDAQTQAPVGGIARLATAVEQVRREDPNRPVMLLFAGDLLQGTITSSLFHGMPDVALFDGLGVDAAVVGNHEFDEGQAAFRHLAEQARFPFLTANVQTHPVPLPVEPAVVIVKSGGPAVAVLGLTTPDLTTATHPRNLRGVSVESPVTVAQRLIPRLRREADLVIVLSHLGLADDQRLARALPDIDLILGGHNHHVLAQPVMEGAVAILQAGERGRWLGRLDLVCQGGRLIRTGYRLLSMDASVAEDPAVAAEVTRIVAESDHALLETIGRTDIELSAQREDIRRQESVFGNLVADLAREITQADVAFFNAGGFRATIPRGKVTLKQIYQAFPFGNELVVGHLTGAQIVAALQRSAAFDPADNPGGFLQVSGVRYAIAGGRLVSASLISGPIDPVRRYKVVMPDFLAAGGDGYTSLTDLGEPRMTGAPVAALLIDAFRTRGIMAPRLDGRIVRLPGLE